MPRLSLARGYSSQPQQNAPPDNYNPLCSRLVSLTNFGATPHASARGWDVVTNTPWTPSGSAALGYTSKGRALSIGGSAGSVTNAGLVLSTKITGPWTVLMVAASGTSTTGVFCSANTQAAPYCANFSGVWSISNSANSSVNSTGASDMQVVAFRQFATTADVTVNGVKGSANAQNYAAFAAGAAYLGDFGSGGGFPITGKIAMCAIWNRALSDSEIKRLTANPWQLFRQPGVVDQVVALVANNFNVSVTEAASAADTTDRSGAGNYNVTQSEAGSAADSSSVALTQNAAIAEAGAAADTDYTGTMPTPVLRQVWRQLSGENDWTLLAPYNTNPVTVTAGNMLVACVTGYYGPNVTIPYPAASSGTFVDATDGTNTAKLTGTRGFSHSLGIIKNSAGGSITFAKPTGASNGTQGEVWIYEVPGMPPNVVCSDVQSTQTSNTTLSWAQATTSAIKKGHLVFAFGSYDGSSGSISTGGLGAPGAGWTQIGLEDTAADLISPAEVAYQIAPADGVLTATWTTTDTSKDYDLALTAAFVPTWGAQNTTVTVSESGSVVDTTSNILSASAAVSEAGSASDTASTGSTQAASVSESGTAADSPSAIMSTSASVGESGTAADSPSAVNSTSAAVVEAGSAADTTSDAVNTPVTVSESGAGVDTTASTVSTTAALSEAGSAVDSPSTSGSTTASVAESGSAADTVSDTVSTSAAVGEAAAASDSATASNTTSVSAAEAANAVDSVADTVSTAVSVAENGSATDSVTPGAITPVSIVEAASASDQTDAQRAIGALITDIMNAQDSTGAQAAWAVEAMEQGDAFDVYAVTAVLGDAINEQGNVQDVLDGLQALGVDIGELVEAVDSANWIAVAQTLVRVYTFGDGRRDYTFPLDVRAYAFPADNRSFTFPADSRSYTFPETP